MSGVHEWIKAWEQGMAEAGYHRAQLSPMMDEDGWCYSWCWDIDAFVLDFQEAPEEAWDTAHRVLVQVDHLRPPVIRPSLALSARLGRDN